MVPAVHMGSASLACLVVTGGGGGGGGENQKVEVGQSTLGWSRHRARHTRQLLIRPHSAFNVLFRPSTTPTPLALIFHAHHTSQVEFDCIASNNFELDGKRVSERVDCIVHRSITSRSRVEVSAMKHFMKTEILEFYDSAAQGETQRWCTSSK